MTAIKQLRYAVFATQMIIGQTENIKSNVYHAVVANNQTCDATEIGIASTVWKKISGSNINNFPGGDTIGDMEDNDAGGTFDMGRMDMYLPRYSFFTIQIRKEGTEDWASTPPVFAVRGEQPTEQHNAIRIYHPRGQHEFRLRPTQASSRFIAALEIANPFTCSTQEKV